MRKANTPASEARKLSARARILMDPWGPNILVLYQDSTDD